MSNSLSVNVRLRAFIDASGNCEARKFFYRKLDEVGPKEAYRLYKSRPDTTPVWDEEITKIIEKYP